MCTCAILGFGGYMTKTESPSQSHILVAQILRLMNKLEHIQYFCYEETKASDVMEAKSGRLQLGQWRKAPEVGSRRL